MTPPSISDNPPDRPENPAADDRRWEHPESFWDTLKGAFPRPVNGEAWGRLLRLPNLLTIPGDILAGFLLASAARPGAWIRLALMIPASLFFYAAGLLLNDTMDIKEDRQHRPERPLPSGAIQRETAAAAALVSGWIAVFLAAYADALPVAVALAAFIILYDVGLKRVTVLGPLLMGACRSANLLLGTVAATAGSLSEPVPWIAALLLGLFIAVVTQLARHETDSHSPVTPRLIGRLLRLLIPLQALLCVLAVHRFPANLLGLLLLPLMRLHRRLSERFSPS